MTKHTAIKPRPSTAELRSVVERALIEHFGRPLRIVAFRRRGSRYASTARIENLFVRLSDGCALELVFKDLSPSARVESAFQVRPSFLDEPVREIDVYRRLLSSVQFDTPLFYGASTDPRSGRFWLFGARVRGSLLWQVGDPHTWNEAAAWLARMHSRARPENLEPGQTSMLLRYDANFYRTWIDRAVAFQTSTSHMLATQAKQLERLAERYDSVIQRLLSLPTTVIHGEFYPSNVIVRADRRLPRICPIDWEMAAIGPGGIDLAALTAGAFAPARRFDILHVYGETVSRWTGQLVKPRDLEDAVAHCQLHLAVQMLGWCAEWRPPPAHSQDWLGIALQLAHRIGVL